MSVTVLLGILSILLAIVIVVLIVRSRGGSLASAMEHIDRRLDQLEKLGSDIDAMSSLFLVPHKRGGLGETLLAELLQTWLPQASYQIQYTFRDGSRVDAVIRLGRYIIPIDAQFPMERVSEVLESGTKPGKPSAELKKIFSSYAEDISRKYIKPDEGTLDFALLYVPSEKVFYHTFVLSDGEIHHNMLKKGVVPVSPSGLFLYLQTVSYGLNGFSLPGKQKELLTCIRQLRKDFTSFGNSFARSGTHLKNLVNAYEESLTHLTRVEIDLKKLENPGQKE